MELKTLFSDVNRFDQENKNLCRLFNKSGSNIYSALDWEDPGEGQLGTTLISN